MSNVHELKADPEVFDAVWRGDKTHEIRLNDRDYRVGDSVFLRETKYTGEQMRYSRGASSPIPLIYTGRELMRKITHILSGYGLEDNWVILSLAPAQGADERIAELQRMLSGARGLVEIWRQRAQEWCARATQGADARPVAFEEWAISEGLIVESHGLMSVSRSCDVARKAWSAALATRDAAPRGDAQDAERYRWATELSDNAETLHSVVLCHEGDPDKINERIDSYRAASAPTEKTS